MKTVGLLIGAAMAWASGVCAQSAQESASRPDIFLVTIDTLRADHVHCYGYGSIQTPALDDLAKDGVRFAEAFTPSPITNTSHISILTGLLPSTHGVMDFAVPVASGTPLWSEVLKNRGYHTAAFIGSVVLDSHRFAPGLDRGFDFYDNFPENPRSNSRWERLERRGKDVVQHAEDWLSKHSAGPKFVWLHFYDPHDPYDPPPPYAQVYENRLYDGEIAYADSALADFVTYLKRKGWYRNSVVIVVGDHGEGLGEHHEQTHGAFLYDATLHVPLIIKLPDQTQAGRVVEAQVRTTDILPTVVDLLRIHLPSHFDGESLAPYFGSGNTANVAKRTAFGETDYPLRFGWAPLRSARGEGFKFIEAPKPELYDLQSDPLELQNNYAPWDVRVQGFRAKMSVLRRKAASRPTSAGAVSSSTIAELEALGYLSGADRASLTDVPEPLLLPDPKDQIEQLNLLHQAMIASEDGRYGEARSALERIVEIEPQSLAALRLLAEMELHQGEYAIAAEHFKRALIIRPDDASSAFRLGLALHGAGDFTGARRSLESSLKSAPTQFPARLLLGQVDLSLGDIVSAKDQFDAALLIEPQNSTAQLWLAKAYIAGGSFTEAAQILESLAKSQHQSAEIFELLTQAYSRLGRKEEAEKAKGRAQSLRIGGQP
jgi:choline-sulfatase